MAQRHVDGNCFYLLNTLVTIRTSQKVRYTVFTFRYYSLQDEMLLGMGIGYEELRVSVPISLTWEKKSSRVKKSILLQPTN